MHLIFKDKWLLAFLTWLPLVIGYFIWMVFSQGLVRELPMGIVDLDHSSLSRQIAKTFDASPDLKVTHSFAGPLDAEKALQAGRVYAYAVIPRNLEKETRLHTPPRITLFYNTQYVLIGKKIISAVMRAQATLNARIDIGIALSKGSTDLNQAMGRILPIRSQTTPLFNPGTNYAQFLVSGILPSLWQVFIVAGTVLVLSANHRQGNLAILLKNQAVTNVFSALANVFPIFLIQGLAFLYFFFHHLGWPFQGSWMVLITAQAVMTSICMVIGALFYFLVMDPPRALSLAGVFTAPGFAFMGVTFPKTDMSPLALAWRGMLPVSHYIEVQIGQANYGLAPHLSLVKLVPLAWGILPLMLLILLINRRAKETIK